ncbi:uncharacterized protein SAPINGB_P006214 [Magnusiomyces paraingens]|uniref:Reverse transcriptase Ty1/copia-type domain-containing protein n=1 Tax=Magnusiomyces paraingens TaxID=2606893 RepID=A0A5E8C5S9_9ASCO|nr:uncharacterized protein SAPINGB_P006214 [Saprochaete ingens]VVT58450.1 unnamed protein product [Saprochaete ingens]
MDGSIDKYKARLVVQGFRQKFGVDYVDTFAPVMRFSTVRLIFALSAAKNCEMHHVDVKNAFLNGDLEEDIYVKPPTGIDHNTPPGMVWKLNKSLYGLKQAPLCWNKKLVDKLEALGYKAAKKEPCLFYKINGKDFSIIGLYVDDILTASNVPGEFERFFKGLSGYFAIKDEGGVNKFLGIRVQDSDRTISLDLEHYIADMIEVFKLSNQTAKSIPLPKKHGLDFPQGLDARPANQSLYRSILGKLQFAAQTARPDIAYATGKLAQYASDPRAIHMDRAYHVLSYLKGTKDLAIVYHKNVPGASPRLLRGWSDADWANDPDRKSISGFAFSHGPSTFSWKSAKQKLTATSTTEAELIAAFSATCEAVYFRDLLKELGESQPTTVIMEDNKGVLDLMKDSKHHERTKHIDTKYMRTRDHVKAGDTRLEAVASADNVADIFTKALAKPQFLYLRNLLGMSTRPQVEGGNGLDAVLVSSNNTSIVTPQSFSKTRRRKDQEIES